MKKKTKIICLIVTVIVLGGVFYKLLPGLSLIYMLQSQMKAGHRYMDSITEEDIPVWTERTKKYLKEYDPNSRGIGNYGLSEDKPVPNDLRELGILRIDIARDSVTYVWLGGMDHTYLYVERSEDGNFKFIGCYNDYRSKTIWPKEKMD